MPICPLCPPGTKVNLAQIELEAHIKKSHSTGQSLECKLCQQKFKTNAGLVQHLATKYHYKCKAPKCSKKYMTPAELTTHTQSHNAGSGNPPASTSKVKATIPAKLPCASCGMKFDGPDALQNHMRVIHLPKSPFPSSIAHQALVVSSSDAGSESVTSYALSSPSHAVPKVQSCSMCKKPFSSVDGLADHMQTVHGKKVYPCPSCAQTFSKKNKLSTHKITAHPAGPICAICRLTCPSQQVLDAHVVAVHPTCVECNQRFEDDAAYATHRRVSHPEPPRAVSPPASHSCPFCDRSFKFPKLLDDHRDAVHPFICGMCKFSCEKEELLQEHIASAHSCPVCHEGVFANADLLNEHLVDHATPYRCEVCQTRYAEEEDLHLHYRDSPAVVHPSCTRCDLSFRDETDYYNHTEAFHPQISCQLCDGALFDPGELPMHYLSSRNHPVCDICQIGFSDQAEFVTHGAMEHPEAYCHLCQWQFESAEALQNHIRHFVAHPKCMDCELRFADVDAYQHHLFVVHRPHCGNVAIRDLDPDYLDNSGEGVTYSEKGMPNPLSSDLVNPTRGFSGNADSTYAQFIPLPPSSSGYSSPLSQRVLTRSSVGSRSSSRTLSPPPASTIKDAYLETYYPVDHSGSPYSPFSNIPAVGTPLVSGTDFRSPSSPCPDTPAFFAPSQLVNGNGIGHSDQESIASAKSPEMNSPVIKLPEHDTSPVSSSGWSTLSGEAVSRMSPKSENSLNQGPTDFAVPVLRLQVPATNGNGTSHTVRISASPSSISPESAGIDISANVTPDYLREARAYLAVTHPAQATSTADHVHSPSLPSPSLSSIGFTASSRERRREVRFDDSIMSEPMWDNRSSESSDSSFDPPVMQNRRKYGIPKRLNASKLPRFAPLRTGRAAGRLNGSVHSTSGSGSGTSSLSPYHCRICRRNTCEDLTTTTCGHLFCNACITDAVIRDSRCPVCSNAVLLYCLFRIDTTCETYDA